MRSTISANAMSVTDTAGQVVLEAANTIGTVEQAGTTGTVAANLTASGSVFSLNDPATALTVGTVGAATSASDPSGLFGALSGVATSNADVNLKSGGLAVNQPVGAGTAIVRLVESGAVSQDATNGAITASSLSVADSGGQVVLEAANNVGTVAASLTKAGSAFTFNNSTNGHARRKVVPLFATSRSSSSSGTSSPTSSPKARTAPPAPT